LIHHIGLAAAVIDWLGEQQFYGRLDYSRAVEIANTVEKSPKTNYIPLGPQWDDLEKLGYDRFAEARRIRSEKKRGLHLPRIKGKSEDPKASD